jgi:hypothetical protein
MKLASFENLDNVKPDVALDAVHQALIRLYELNGMNAAETKVSLKVVDAAAGQKPKMGVQNSTLKGRTQSSRLASSILLDIQSAEGHPIQDLSREKLGQYTGVLSGLVQKKMQIESAADNATVEEIRQRLKAVKY